MHRIRSVIGHGVFPRRFTENAFLSHLAPEALFGNSLHVLATPKPQPGGKMAT
jgi:hypothetical protein